MNEAEQAAGSSRTGARRVELQERLNELNQQINEQGFQQANNRPGGFGQGAYVSQLISQRDAIRMNLAEIVMTQKSIKDEAGPEKKELEAASKKSLEAATAALAGRTGGGRRGHEAIRRTQHRRFGQKCPPEAGERQGRHLQARTFNDVQDRGEGVRECRTDDPGEADDRGAPEEGKIEAVIVRGPESPRRNEPSEWNPASGSSVAGRRRGTSGRSGRTRPDWARLWHRRQGDRGRRTGIGPGRRFGTRERVAADGNGGRDQGRRRQATVERNTVGHQDVAVARHRVISG